MFKLRKKGFYPQLRLIVWGHYFFMTMIGCGIGPLATIAQTGKVVATGFDSLFSKAALFIDTSVYRYPEDMVMISEEGHWAFHFNDEASVIELRLWPRRAGYFTGKQLELEALPDMDILDSLVWVDDQYFRSRIRCKSLSRSDRRSLMFLIRDNERSRRVHLPLFPYTTTRVTFYPGEEDLYIGEEKRFEIVTNQLANLRLSGEWVRGKDFDTRQYLEDGVGYLSVVPHFVGSRSLEVIFETNKPFLTEEGDFSYQLPIVQYNIGVKESRLRFLRMDQREVIREQDNREGVEVQLENDRHLKIHKTYRIEDREEKGGPLVAELYTVRYLSNDKVLCLLRPYLYHKVQDGYLYVKDGDEAEFITNVGILPEVKISGVQILREGQGWQTSKDIRPGERLEIQFDGEGFSQANLVIEGLDIISQDTVASNDQMLRFLVDVPLDLRKQKLAVYNKGKDTGVHLNLVEFQRPRPFDFISVSYGEGYKTVNTLNEPIFYGGSVRDVVIHFDESKIDQLGQLYGRQLLEIEVRITGAKGELIEMQTLNQVVVCPGENSMRHAFYQGQNCQKQDVSLNQLLFRKTHGLDPWSRIEIVIKHKKDAYGGQGYYQKVEIILHRPVTFDVEVTFPAGLMIKRVGVDGFPGLGGISLAMLAEFSFYHQNQVRKLKPFKLGGGFLAQNAFNFNPESTDRDLGIVVIGSVYPILRDRKLSFPLYAGFGYFLNDQKFFYLLGPGIRVNF
jgi:hypothetical protein